MIALILGVALLGSPCEGGVCRVNARLVERRSDCACEDCGCGSRVKAVVSKVAKRSAGVAKTSVRVVTRRRGGN